MGWEGGGVQIAEEAGGERGRDKRKGEKRRMLTSRERAAAVVHCAARGGVGPGRRRRSVEPTRMTWRGCRVTRRRVRGVDFFCFFTYMQTHFSLLNNCFYGGRKKTVLTEKETECYFQLTLQSLNGILRSGNLLDAIEIFPREKERARTRGAATRRNRHGTQRKSKAKRWGCCAAAHGGSVVGRRWVVRASISSRAGFVTDFCPRPACFKAAKMLLRLGGEVLALAPAPAV